LEGEFLFVSILEALYIAQVTNFYRSNALGSSMLECRLYAKRILKDKFIGGTKDAIELLLAEGASGSLYDPMLSAFH
jgi:hypothetical protein